MPLTSLSCIWARILFRICSIGDLDWRLNNPEIRNSKLIVSPNSKTVKQSDASKKVWVWKWSISNHSNHSNHSTSKSTTWVPFHKWWKWAGRGGGGGYKQSKKMIAISKEIWESTSSKDIMRPYGLPEISKTQTNATISKSIPRNLYKVGIPRVGPFCIRTCHQVQLTCRGKQIHTV